jgi:hypothetical protein
MINDNTALPYYEFNRQEETALDPGKGFYRETAGGLRDQPCVSDWNSYWNRETESLERRRLWQLNGSESVSNSFEYQTAPWNSMTEIPALSKPVKTNGNGFNGQAYVPGMMDTYSDFEYNNIKIVLNIMGYTISVPLFVCNILEELGINILPASSDTLIYIYKYGYGRQKK